MVCRLSNVMIPYFNAGIYLENKAKIGKVEEVFGPINKVYFTIKPDSGVNAKSFKADDKVYIGTDKLLPLSRFTNEVVVEVVVVAEDLLVEVVDVALLVEVLRDDSVEEDSVLRDVEVVGALVEVVGALVDGDVKYRVVYSTITV